MISRKNILELNARQIIYNYIKENPGQHLREVSRNIDIPFTTLRYHIRVLLNLELIELKFIDHNKKFFASGEVNNLDKQLLSIIRKKIPFRIYMQFLFSGMSTQKELSEELEVDPATISYHLKKMIKLGIIEQAPIENGNVYPFLNKNFVFKDRKPAGREIYYRRKYGNQFQIRIYRLIITNKDSIKDKDLIESFINWLNSLCNIGLLNKKINKSSDKKVNNVNYEQKHWKNISFCHNIINACEEIIRPPFCA